MARIRSVHPGLFTDEGFVGLAPQAQVLLIGLWTEADDNGVFEWKPLTIKMRLLPAANVDVGALLEELEAADCIKKIDVEGRSYGLVRNFGRYQRPKKPNPVHPLPNQYRTYVAVKGDSSPPVPHQFPTSSEIPNQMEDGEEDVGEGVGKREGESAADAAAPPAEPDSPSKPVPPAEQPSGADSLELPQFLKRKQPHTLPEDWLPSADDREWARQTVPAVDLDWEAGKFRDHWHGNRKKHADWTRTFHNWLRRAEEFRRERGGKTAPAGGGDAGADWSRRLEGFRDSGFWLDGWGAKPGGEFCIVPQAILTQHGYGQKTEAA